MKNVVSILVGLMLVPVVAVIKLFGEKIEVVEGEIVEDKPLRKSSIDESWDRYFKSEIINLETRKEFMIEA